MYKLTFDGQPIYDPRGANEADQLIIVEPSVSLAVNAAGSVSFSIYPTHPMYGKITRMRGDLELLDDDGPIFRGRVLDDEATFYGAKKYTAEGALAFLNDSMVDPYVFPDDFRNEPGFAAASQSSGNLVAWWLGWLLDKHNATAQPNRRIKLGTVTVKDPNNYISRENSNYSSTWETISEKLVGSTLGGYMLIRYEDDGNYLDYLADLPGTNAQAVTFGQNLLDIIIKVTGSDLYTAILPVGADGLTLAGLPDGPVGDGLVKAGKIIYDPAAEAEYGGRITRTSKWDDVTVAANLQAKAAATLRSGVRVPESFTVHACDLNSLDGSTPHFRVGRYVRIKSDPHGIDEAYPLLEITPNLLEPGATVICLNTTKAKFTAEVRRAQVATDQAMHSAIAEASKELNDRLDKASCLYCTPEPQPDGSTIYYLHDKQTLGESTYIIKLTSEVIGFSTNGGASYPYGFTVTGEMVMNAITAHGISADYINAGTLQSLPDESGEQAFYLDLINGILKMKATELTVGGRTVQDIAGSAAQSKIDGLTQEEVFNKLTNDGDLQGLFMRGGELYVNASYLQAGTINLSLLKLAGTICGLMQGYGMTASGTTTQGIVIYGNGASGDDANPPYLIITNAGIRGQADNYHSFNMTGWAFEVLGNITAQKVNGSRGNISAGGDITADGALKGQTLNITGGASIGYGRSDPIQIGRYGSDLGQCYWRSMTDADGNTYMVLTQA